MCMPAVLTISLDMADFTEANDKIYLGKNANKAAARRLRGEIGELIADR